MKAAPFRTDRMRRCFACMAGGFPKIPEINAKVFRKFRKTRELMGFLVGFGRIIYTVANEIEGAAGRRRWGCGMLLTIIKPFNPNIMPIFAE